MTYEQLESENKELKYFLVEANKEIQNLRETLGDTATKVIKAKEVLRNLLVFTKRNSDGYSNSIHDAEKFLEEN